jgi:carbon monoxide dehydrogenase subunit G
VKLENSFQVPVPAPEAWKVLLDVERIAPCVPGATLTGTEGETHKGTVKVKLGPIGLTYNGTVTFVSTDEANGIAVIEASGREARGNGTAKALVTCKLIPAGDVTDVQVETDLAITGKPAQFGRGALNEVAGTLIGQFADNLAKELSGSQAPVAEAAPASASVDAAPLATTTEIPARPAAPAREAEPIDLLAIAPGGNVLKIAAVAVPAFLLGLIVARLFRRR